MKKLRIIYSGTPSPDASRITVPVSWPVVADCPTEYQYEAQTRCLFSNCQYRLLSQEITDKMIEMWAKQYQIAAYALETDPDLFHQVYGSIWKANTKYLSCPPAVVRLDRATSRRYYKRCDIVTGQCPFCWARRVKGIFEQFARALFGRVPRGRDEQAKLKNDQLFLYEHHEPQMVEAIDAVYPKAELGGIQKRDLWSRRLKHLMDLFQGMSTIVTIEYCTPGGCKVWIRRLGIMVKPFSKMPEGIECVMHPPALTMQKLAEVIGRVFAYPYRDLSVPEMMPVLERFARMRTRRKRMRLLSSTGIFIHRKPVPQPAMQRKEP